jgi:hypothetical protein
MINQRTKIDKRLLALFLLLLVPLFSSGQESAKAGHESGSASCEREVVKDYLAPLSGARPAQEIPPSGILPFGPQGLRLLRLGNGPTADGRAIGYSLADIALNQQRRLNWVVRTTLIKVNATGRPVKILDRKADYIATRNFSEGSYGGQRFHVPVRPTNYRVDITFERKSGKKLGSYSEYFRVMKPRYQAVMRLSDGDVAPGQTIQARIENLGTEPIMAELHIAIEWYDGTNWILRDKVYPDGKVIDGRTYVFGGETGPCFAYKVPADLGYGKFRVTEETRRYLRNGQRRHASAEFKVSQP